MMKRFHKTMQSGMTLMEITVVLLILIALAGMVVPYVNITSGSATCQATDATLQAVKQAIMGGKAGPGYYADTLGNYPADRGDIDYNLKYLFIAGDKDEDDSIPDWPAYNPKTGIGWHGPYLSTGGLVNEILLHNSFGTVFDSSSPEAIAIPAHVHVNITTDTGSQVFDAWHRPIVLQIPYYDADGEGSDDIARYHPENARLISAGPGSGLRSYEAAIDTTIQSKDASDRDDDRVLFLNGPDLGRNKPCDE
ncbi:type II secretion system protein [Methylobacter marinus]|uniref:type II secretion system protein n=1 Tax=Methylobacter marinus TaxID=34058 RepID=UPI00056C2BBB|nr:type II secretion system GspH family protein [Methylobacter marinus]